MLHAMNMKEETVGVIAIFKPLLDLMFSIVTGFAHFLLNPSPSPDFLEKHARYSSSVTFVSHGSHNRRGRSTGHVYQTEDASGGCVEFLDSSFYQHFIVPFTSIDPNQRRFVHLFLVADADLT